MKIYLLEYIKTIRHLPDDAKLSWVARYTYGLPTHMVVGVARMNNAWG